MCVIAFGPNRLLLDLSNFQKASFKTNFLRPYYRLAVKLVLAYNFTQEQMPFGRKN